MFPLRRRSPLTVRWFQVRTRWPTSADRRHRGWGVGAREPSGWREHRANAAVLLLARSAHCPDHKENDPGDDKYAEQKHRPTPGPYAVHHVAEVGTGASTVYHHCVQLL